MLMTLLIRVVVMHAPICRVSEVRAPDRQHAITDLGGDLLDFEFGTAGSFDVASSIACRLVSKAFRKSQFSFRISSASGRSVFVCSRTFYFTHQLRIIDWSTYIITPQSRGKALRVMVSRRAMGVSEVIYSSERIVEIIESALMTNAVYYPQSLTEDQIRSFLLFPDEN